MIRLLPLFAAVWISAGAAQAEVLNRNGGFEELSAKEGQLFADWGFHGGFEKGDYQISSAAPGHGGDRACGITCLKKGRAGLSTRELSLKPGTVMEATCWIRADAAGNGRIFLNFEGTPGDGWATRELKTGSYDWTPFTLRATVPPNPNGGDHRVVVYLYTTCEGIIQVDDFTVNSLENSASSAPVSARRVPAAVEKPAGSAGYRMQVAPALEKVFLTDDFAAGTATGIHVEAARNEYESIQLVVEAPWETVRVESVDISSFTGQGGVAIPASAARWDRVGYIETTTAPPYYAGRGLDHYPDPLLPPGPFTVEPRSRAPIWITLKTPRDCPAGDYHGTVTITVQGDRPCVLPVKLTVWDFALADETRLRTLTWLSRENLRNWYRLDASPEGNRKLEEAMRHYEDCLLEHRLGPGGEAADHVPRRKDGTFDFSAVDARLERLIGKGLNAFIMGTAPNLSRAGQTTYRPEFVAEFTQTLQAYSSHLAMRGWLDKAWVYVYDEAPKAAWPEVKRISDSIHAAVPGARILQCLNEPEGVRALTGFADVFDVYVPHYHTSGVAAAQKTGTEVWLAICCYPMEHPNLFLEYPLLDARITPWICWKYQARGFEYWSPVSWGANIRPEGPQWPEVPWVANTFGKYNGDGYLLYPGPDLKPWSSLRLEALRDGLEDYEYLHILHSLLSRADAAGITGPSLEAARRLPGLEGVVSASGAYGPEAGPCLNRRRAIAEACVSLRQQLESGK